jgi:hypothetical protein
MIRRPPLPPFCLESATLLRYLTAAAIAKGWRYFQFRLNTTPLSSAPA